MLLLSGVTIHYGSDAMERKIQSTIKDQDLLTERRALLCETCAKLFRKNGYHNTTIQNIADESGISVGSIYRYVKTKEDIMYLMLQYYSNLMDVEVYPLVKMNLPPFEKLFLAMRNYYTLIDQNADYFHVSLRDMKLVTGFRSALQQREDMTIDCFSNILKEGISSGDFASVPVEVLSYNLIMFGHVWILRSYRFKGEKIEYYIQQQYELVERLLRGNR